MYGTFIDEMVEMGISHAAIALYLPSLKQSRNNYNKIIAKFRPMAPNDLTEVDITEPYNMTTDNKPFMRYDNRTQNGRIIIFISDNGLLMLHQADHWQMDGTFKSAPQGFSQVYIIYAYYKGDFQYFSCNIKIIIQYLLFNRRSNSMRILSSRKKDPRKLH
jgi:hypothetical protein